MCYYITLWLSLNVCLKRSKVIVFYVGGSVIKSIIKSTIVTRHEMMKRHCVLSFRFNSALECKNEILQEEFEYCNYVFRFIKPVTKLFKILLDFTESTSTVLILLQHNLQQIRVSMRYQNQTLSISIQRNDDNENDHFISKKKQHDNCDG